jgi:hypothetical protein
LRPNPPLPHATLPCGSISKAVKNKSPVARPGFLVLAGSDEPIARRSIEVVVHTHANDIVTHTPCVLNAETIGSRKVGG